jgi:hypothetical protein
VIFLAQGLDLAPRYAVTPPHQRRTRQPYRQGRQPYSKLLSAATQEQEQAQAPYQAVEPRGKERVDIIASIY